MRWRTRFAVLAAPALALGGLFVATGSTGAAGDTTTQSQTFAFTGAEQAFVVPAGVTSITVTVSGAQGGDGSGCTIGGDPFCGTPGVGGNGATVTGTVAVTPGETLRVFTGGAGVDATPANDTTGDPSVGGDGGFGLGHGGAGNESVVVGAGGGGGGASAILRGTTPIAVAAGGGGGGGSAAQEDENNPLLDGGNGGASSTNGSPAEAPCQGFGGEPAVGSFPGVGGGPSSVDNCVEGAQASNPGGDADTVDGGNASAGAMIAEDVQAAGGGGGGGGFAGGGGASGGSASRPQLGGGGGGGGGSCLAPTGGAVVDGARAGDGVVVISWGVVAAAPISAPPAFTG